MTNFILFILFIFSLFSCNQKFDNHQAPSSINTDISSDSLPILNDPKNNLNIQMTNFFEIDSSGILMFPLSIGETKRVGSNAVYKEMPNNGYWNIIFYDSKNKEHHLLSEKKMLIIDYDYKYILDNDEDVKVTTPHIFYTIRTDDFNKDKKLNELDPQYLFISDKMGLNFKQISPSDHTIQNWKFIKSTNKVILTARKDSDKNNKFDNEDEVATFEIALQKDSIVKEIFDMNFKNDLKNLFDKDWKRLKE